MRYLIFEDDSVMVFSPRIGYREAASGRAVHSAGVCIVSVSTGVPKVLANGCTSAINEIGKTSRIGDGDRLEEVLLK